MDFEEITKYLGGFGTYQKRLYFTVCLTGVFTAFQVLGTVFTFGVPDHRCAVAGYDNSSYTKFNKNESNGFMYNGRLYGQCSISQFAGKNHTIVNSTTCDQWVYDDSIFHTSIVSEMDIVCDRKLAKSHAQMLIMLGQVTGCVLVGPLSDVFGRRAMLFTFVIIHIISSIAVTWSSTIRVTLAFYFFIGTSISGCFTPAFVLGMELVGPDKRKLTGIIIELFWSLGSILLSAAAYWIRNWQHLQLVIAVPSVILLSYFWILSESPRWLISKGRYKEAEKIIREAARVNKVVLPERLFARCRLRHKEVESLSIMKIFTSKILLFRTIIIYINWATCSLSFYGISLNAGNLSGSIHLNFFLLCAIEIPGYILCIVLLDRIGRRMLHCLSLLLCGLCLILSIFTILYADTSLSWITTLLAVIGKLGVTVAFAVMWMYTSELFPTVLRNSGVGSSNLMARVGGAICPYVANLGLSIPGDIGRVTPLIIFGLTSIIAGLLALFLPETKGRRLPETIEDAEKFGQKQIVTDTGEELKILSSL